MLPALLLFLSSYLILRVNGQTTPTAVNPPHNCSNYGLCQPFVMPYNETYLYCPAAACVCQPGTTGPGCSLIIDKCTNSTCSANSICSSTVAGTICTCMVGFTGPNCDIPLSSPCATGPCQNGGTCTQFSSTLYNCTCPSGWLPPDCIFPNPCTSNPCGNNGNCSMIWDGASYFCNCNFDYIGRNCESRKTQWSMTSLNVGGCFPYSDVSKYISDPTKYKKITDPKMTFSMCSNILRTYTSSNIIYTSFVVMENDCYLTTRSDFNVSGNLFGNNPKDNDCYRTCPGDLQKQPQQQEVCGTNNKKVVWGIDNTTTVAPDKCSSSYVAAACLNDTGKGICVNVSPTLIQYDSYMCVCKPPFQETGVIDSCASGMKSPCVSAPCKYGVCTAAPNYQDYNCNCNPGYTGKNCSYVDPCKPNPCANGGTCTDLQDGTYSCKCLQWYHGPYCGEIDTCEYANKCVHGNCQDIGQGIQVRQYCRCDAGYNGAKCDREINFCTSYIPCQYNSSCTPKFNGYDCSCIPGTKGTNCSEIINNCVEYKDADGNKFPTRCNTKDGLAQCINAINNFTCNCTSQWRGRYCDLNVKIEEVMMTIFGEVNYDMLPLLNNLLTSPAAINNMVPFIIGTMSSQERSNLSWDFSDMFYWAAYEEKTLQITRDFVKTNDVVLGNCFTFNQMNATQRYDERVSMIEGGLRVKMKINQDEYQPWTETAAIIVFIHTKDVSIFSESVRYNAEPNNEVLVFPYASEFTRLGGKYGRCVTDPSEVKSYYYPGRYTADGCYRSCYQDLVLKSCGCMDPRYPMPEKVTSCKVTDMICIDNTIDKYGDPSGWNFCSCPVPCTNQDFSMTWSKTAYRNSTVNCLAVANSAKDETCQNFVRDSVRINIAVPKLTYSLLQEQPSMDINKLIGNLGGLLGVLMGICAIFVVEVALLGFKICSTICCYKGQTKKNEEEKKTVEDGGPKKETGEALNNK